jgi:WD40 repeat protein/anti-sigma factor RsiW
VSEIDTCSDTERLRNLLDGRLSDEEQAELNRHLEGCPSCQQRLEGLAAGTQTWTAAAGNLHAGFATPEAGLERILAQSKGEEPGEVETPPADTPLDFLSPSDDPAHLGRLGNYQILSVIGRGGMSVVLKAFDPSLHRVVAIKVLAPQLATNAAARTRFQREGCAAAAISHEHVVGVYAVDEINGLPYLVMEYISGESLQERLDRTGPLELKEVLRIGMQIAQGLAAAHAQGLVHRDIKPANILLHNGVARVKITDFGLARAVDDATLTQSGLIAGTPQYMSPEQARGDAIDARTDLFSLGSVLYAMCSGRPPFRASTTMGVLKRVTDEIPRAVREVNAEVPPWLADIIGKLHAKNPAERFQSAAEVVELLGRYLAEVQQGTPASALALQDSSSPPTPRHFGQYRKRAWSIAAAVLPVFAGMFVVSEATGVTNMTEYMATVLRIKTPEGTLVVETDDPGIEVAVDGGEVTIHGAGPKEIRVRAGDHRIRATKDGKEVPVEEPLVTVARGGKTIVRIRQEIAQGEASAPKAGGTANTVEKPAQQAIRVRVRMKNGKPEFRIEGRLVDPSKLGHELRAFLKATAKTHLMLEVENDVPHSAVVAVQNAAKEAGIERVNFVGVSDSNKATPKGLREIAVLSGHEGVVRALAFTPDGKALLSAGGGPDGPTTNAVSGELRLWDMVQGKEKWSVESPSIIFAAALSSGGGLLVTAEGDGTVRYRDADTGQVGAIFRGHKGPVYTVALSPQFNPIASAGLDRTVKIWRHGTTAELLESFDSGNTERVNCLAFSPDGKTLAVGGEDHLTLHGPAIADADGNIIVKKRPIHSARLFNAGSWKLRAVLAGHERPIRQLVFSPDGKTLATASEDGTVKLWNVADGKDYFILPKQAGKLYCLAFSPDGRMLATGGEGPVTVWRFRQLDRGMWGVFANVPSNQNKVLSIAFHPDGKVLAFAGTDRTIKLWSMP